MFGDSAPLRCTRRTCQKKSLPNATRVMLGHQIAWSVAFPIGGTRVNLISMRFMIRRSCSKWEIRERLRHLQDTLLTPEQEVKCSGSPRFRCMSLRSDSGSLVFCAQTACPILLLTVAVKNALCSVRAATSGESRPEEREGCGSALPLIFCLVICRPLYRIG